MKCNTFCRVISFSLAVMFSFVTFVPCFVVRSKAVLPVGALAASAAFTYCASAGVRMWRNGEHEYDSPVDVLVEDMQTIWGWYKDAVSDAPSWADYVSLASTGVTVEDGNFIYSYDSALTLQGFTDWMGSYFDMKPNETYSVVSSSSSTDAMYFTLPADEREGLTYFTQGVWALPAVCNDHATLSRNANTTELTLTNGGYLIAVEATGNPVSYVVYGIKTSNDSSVSVVYKTNGSVTGSATWPINFSVSLSGVSRPNNGNQFTYYESEKADWHTSYWQSDLPYNSADTSNNAVRTKVLQEAAYVCLAGDPVGGSNDLFATTAQSILNRVYDLIPPIVDESTGEVIAPGQSLSIDIGASSEAGADELVQDVVDYVANGGIQSTFAIPEVISGNLELYPQAEDIELVVGENVLSFGDLGHALTTRFPFCIPWDLAYLVESFRVPEKPINVRIDIVPASWKQRYNITGDTSFAMDLTGSEWYLLRQMLAWALIISVICQLALLTRNFVNNLSS